MRAISIAAAESDPATAVRATAVAGASPALVGQIRAGSFPRQFALSPDGRTLYVTNFASSQLETIGVADLVSAAKPGAARR